MAQRCSVINDYRGKKQKQNVSVSLSRDTPVSGRMIRFPKAISIGSRWLCVEARFIFHLKRARGIEKGLMDEVIVSCRIENLNRCSIVYTGRLEKRQISEGGNSGSVGRFKGAVRFSRRSAFLPDILLNTAVYVG